MRGILQHHLQGLKAAWDDGLRQEVFRSAIAFCVLAVIAFGAALALPDLRTQLMSWAVEAVSGTGAIREDGSISALRIFSNNVEACVFTMAYGLVPFLQLPALALGVNAMLLGVLAACYAAEGSSLLIYLAALFPHGLLEFPALILSFAVGLYVCGQATRRCRRDETALRLWDRLLLISRTLFVLLPVLAAASLLEAYVTPAFVSLLIS
ncbi:stage II sporulation protein M [uncultured Dysosmobacter sp.]|uniref:stage II sporulation protein M n=1 Tax=uncultured Dysosmobacter sp. TaxID=2591384 RepID=UPI002606AF34|nr:stage II sporulation protein M [uncultured Dysosmobacter sp.]